MNLSKLLTPIDPLKPTGLDLREIDFSTSLYYLIKDDRNAARLIERQQIQGTEHNAQPNWSCVYQNSLKALEEETKDLEIIAWLIEASLREYGFHGLALSLTLAKDMINLFWEDLYPLPDEEGMVARIAPFVGLNGEDNEGVLIAPIALAPIIEGSHKYSLWHYQQAIEISKITDHERREKRIQAGAPTLEAIEQAAKEMAEYALQKMHQDLLKCKTAYQALSASLDEKLGSLAPPSSRITQQINSCIDFLESISNGRLRESVTNEVNNEFNEYAEKLTETDVSNLNSSCNSVSDREAALKSIAAAADFFRKTEPHSPIPYLLERALKWSSLPFPALMKELIRNEEVMNDFCDLTGMNFDDK